MEWKLPDMIVVGVPEAGHSLVSDMLPTLAGALVGGFVVIAGDYLLRKREQHQDFIERDYELYLEITAVINDVWSIGSRYLPVLDEHGWPTAPWSVMQPAIGETEHKIKIPARLLSTIRGRAGQGLPHLALEMTNFRNIIMVANAQFQDLHTKVVEIGAPFADITQGTRMGANLDPKNPSHKPLIVASERADSMAKQLLVLILDFYDYTIQLSQKYNEYHSTHKVKSLRKLLIDLTGIEIQMKKYSSLREAI